MRLSQDLRSALRQLRRRPGFTAAAALTLAIGIGANTAIFALVDAALLSPPEGVREPDRLALVYTSDFSGPAYGSSSWSDYRDFLAGTPALDGLAAYTARTAILATSEGGERVLTEMVSADYFEVLGARAAAGRLIGSPEAGTRERPSVAPVVVLSHELWRDRFGGDPGLVGRSVRVNGRPVTVIGVAPEGFQGMLRPADVDLWLPLGAGPLLFDDDPDDLLNRGNRGLFLVGRVRPGAGASTVEAQLAVVAARLQAEHPDAWTDVRGERRRVTVIPEARARVFPDLQEDVGSFLAILMAAVGLVLLLATANVAGLLLARGEERSRELAVRRALGAGRGRLTRQLLVESLLLAGLGGTAGVALATWLTALAESVEAPFPVPLRLEIGLDPTVLAFALGITAASAVLFGLVPALRAGRRELTPTLRGEAASLRVGGRRIGLRDALVVGQLAISTALLVGAALFGRSLARAAGVELGFRPERVLVSGLAPGLQGYTPERGRQFWDEVLERARRLPGVESAALGEVVPLSLRGQRRGVQLEGYEPRAGEDMEFDFNLVSTGYFSTLGIPLLRGRAFTEADREGGEPVAIVNAAFAERFWPGGEAIGRRIGYGALGDARARIVGVVGDVKLRSRGEEGRPAFYAPTGQEYEGALTLHVRTAGDPAAAIPLLRDAVEELDANLPLIDPRPLEEAISVTLAPQRVGTAVLVAFAAAAVALSLVGVYGLLAYSVARRTRELGIRLALGATRGRVIAGVLRRALLAAGAGALLGLAAAAAGSGALRGFLFGVGSLDLLTYATATGFVLVIALAAAWAPAWRAAAVDPAVTLRRE